MKPELYILSRKIHRFMVNTLIILSLLMTATGIMMKYNWYIINPIQIRSLHSTLSPFFAIVLTVSAVSGYYMYLYTRPGKKEKNLTEEN